MKEKLQNNIEKWEAELVVLESLRTEIDGFALFAEDDVDSEAGNNLDERIAAIVAENGWLKIQWSKAIYFSEGDKLIKKIQERIRSRKKKIEESLSQLEKIKKESRESEKQEKLQNAGAMEELTPDQDEEIVGETGKPEADAPEPIEVTLGMKLFHWIYGEMVVIHVGEDYLYCKMKDKKGCKHGWKTKNLVTVETDKGDVETKEFHLSCLGKWLYEDKEKVGILDEESAHKIFKV